MPVGVFENPDLLLAAFLPGSTDPKKPRAHLCTKALSVHWYQEKGFQFTVCPYGAKFVQSLILKSCQLHSGSVCLWAGEKGVHTPCTRLPGAVSALEASTQQ